MDKMLAQINVVKKEENIFIMRNNQYLPSLGQQQTRPDPTLILRRRNLSLSSSQQPSSFLQKSETHTQQRCDFIYASRKNQLLIKKARFKGKDFTKLCQDNLAEYFSLKNKVTQPYTPSGGISRRQNTTNEKRFKLSLKLFSPHNVSHRKSQFPPDYRPRTESQSRQNEQQITPASISKKYSQMSLKQIVQGGQNFQLTLRSKFKSAQVSEAKKRSRKESQDYQINGW